MDAAGGYASAPNKMVEGYGTTNTTVKAALNYNSDQYEKPAEQTVKILPDGSAAVAYYYPRKKYTLTVKKGDYTQEVIGGGTYYWGERVTINATPNASPNPVITYVFKNWQGYQYSRTKEYTFTMPAYNTEMVANCTEKDLYKYNAKTTTNGQVINGVTFKKFTSYASGEGSAADTENTNANTDIIETKRKQGQNITQFPDVQKEGYQSTGWYTAPTGGTRVDKTTTMPDAATSYYAQWKPNTYTIKFRNGSKESYAKGGFPTQINNVQYDSQSDINIAGCDAKAWRGSITFDTCGGTFSGGEDGKRTTYSTTLKWTTGYNGSNWGDSSQRNNSLKYNKDGMSYGNNADGHDTIKKYAGGTIENTVTNLIQGYEYQRNNGATMYLYAQYSGVEDTTAPASDKISRSHYNFLGWYTAANGGSKKADGGGTLTDQNGYLTYYAHWDPWDATIKYDGNSGYPTNASTSVGGSVANQTITYDEENQVKNNGFSRTGYIFTGWNTKADGSGTSVTPGQKLYNKFWSSPNLLPNDLSTMTLYAQWRPIHYTIKFHKNDGSGNTDTQNMTYDQAADLKRGSFSRGTGWSFDKWTADDGSSYGDGANVNNLRSYDGQIYNLYAQWTWHAPMKTSGGEYYYQVIEYKGVSYSDRSKVGTIIAWGDPYKKTGFPASGTSFSSNEGNITGSWETRWVNDHWEATCYIYNDNSSWNRVFKIYCEDSSGHSHEYGPATDTWVATKSSTSITMKW